MKLLTRISLIAALLLCAQGAQAQTTQTFPEVVIGAPGHERVWLNVVGANALPEPVTVFLGIDGDRGLLERSYTVTNFPRLSVALHDWAELAGDSPIKIGYLRVVCTTCVAQLVLRSADPARFWDPIYVNPAPPAQP